MSTSEERNRLMECPTENYQACLDALVDLIYEDSWKGQRKPRNIVLCVGVVFTMMAGFLILRFKKHPYPLFAWELLLNAGFLFATGNPVQINNVPLYYS